MNEFCQRIKPVHLAVFGLISLNFAGYVSNDEASLVWAEVGSQPTPPPDLVEQSINPAKPLTILPSVKQAVTIFNPEIREIQSTNFLPKLPSAPIAQAIPAQLTPTIAVSEQTKPTATKSIAPAIKAAPVRLVQAQAPDAPKPDAAKAPENIIEKSQEKTPERPIETPKVETSFPVSTPDSNKPVAEPVGTIPNPVPSVVPSTAPAQTKTSDSDTPIPPGAPGISMPKRTSASNSSVFDTGIKQTPALTIPTTPSQIKIERTQPISLREALQIAETNSQTIKQAAIAVQRARAVVDEAAAARNPNVDVQGSYAFSDSADARQANIQRSPLFGSDNSTITQPLSGTVQLSYNVFTSGLNEAQIKAAEERLRATEADLTRVRQATFLDITNAYIDLQDTDETVRIRSASVNARRLSLRDTQSLERAGVGTRFDVLQSEVQLSNAQQQLLTAQNNQQVRRRTLAQQLQFPPNLNLSAGDRIEPAPDWKLSLEETILQALRNRSELDIQKLTASASLNQAKAEIARLGPQVALTASADLRDNFSNVGGLSFGYTLGARVSWRLFDGGVANARVRQFESDRDLAESRFDQGATQIRLEVESAYFTLDSTRDQITTSARAVESAAEALRLARLRLTAGVGTQLEVIRAEEDLTQAEVNRSTAIIGFNRAQAALQRSLNTVSPR